MRALGIVSSEGMRRKRSRTEKTAILNIRFQKIAVDERHRSAIGELIKDEEEGGKIMSATNDFP